MAPHVRGAVLLVDNGTLRPVPHELGGVELEEPDVVEDVARASAAAQDDEVVGADLELGLAVAGERVGLRDLGLEPAAG